MEFNPVSLHFDESSIGMAFYSKQLVTFSDFNLISLQGNKPNLIKSLI